LRGGDKSYQAQSSNESGWTPNTLFHRLNAKEYGVAYNMKWAGVNGLVDYAGAWSTEIIINTPQLLPKQYNNNSSTILKMYLQVIIDGA
jgi:hypothetical protein